MKKIGLIAVWVGVYLVGVVYLILPSPSIADLEGALKSNEPGDTWQNPDTKAFFTNYDREHVINFYKQSFRLKIGGVNLPNLRLNYRPEDTSTYVRKHIDSYYLEEIVIPLRESVFINGWEPKKSPTLAHLTPEQLETTKIVIDGQEFEAKITVKWYQSKPEHRVVVWSFVVILAPLIVFMFGNSVKFFLTSLFSSIKRK